MFQLAWIILKKKCYFKKNNLKKNNLKTVIVDLKKLSDVVDNEVVKNPKIQHTNDKS